MTSEAPPPANAQDHAAQSRTERHFARAERHSRRVRRMKMVLPALAVLAVSGFAAWTYLGTPSLEGVSVEGAALSDGKLVMANPKLDGFTRENLPYTMTAARAIQSLDNTGVIALEKIDAKLPVSAQTTATVVADSGIYDNNANTLVLDSAVRVTTNDGLEATLQSALLDIGGGGLRTDDPVDIVRQGSRITADSMQIESGGKVLIFERRVKVNLQSGDGLLGKEQHAAN